MSADKPTPCSCRVVAHLYTRTCKKNRGGEKVSGAKLSFFFVDDVVACSVSHHARPSACTVVDAFFCLNLK